MRQLFIRLVSQTDIYPLLLVLRDNALPIPLSILPYQVEAEDEAGEETHAKAYHHAKEAGRVARGFVLEEELRSDDIPTTVGDEDLSEGSQPCYVVRSDTSREGLSP